MAERPIRLAIVNGAGPADPSAHHSAGVCTSFTAGAGEAQYPSGDLNPLSESPTMNPIPSRLSSAAAALGLVLAACAPGAAAAATPPVGQYGCASAPAVLAGSGGYGTMLHQLGHWEGDIWILDGHRYAGPYHQNDVGTYRMQGDKLVALTGAYSPSRNKTEIVYAPAAADHKAALHIAFLGDDGKPQIGLWCVQK